MTSKNGYAAGTSVPVERSKAELDRILHRVGADERGIINQSGFVTVAFRLEGVTVRLRVPLKPIDEVASEANLDPPRGWKGWTPAKRRSWCEREAEQVERERWRVLVLLCKAKLEAVALGHTTVKREFLHDIVVKGGRTVGEVILGQLEAEKSPTLLLGSGR
jgi:hypothetical protein